MTDDELCARLSLPVYHIVTLLSSFKFSTHHMLYYKMAGIGQIQQQ